MGEMKTGACKMLSLEAQAEMVTKAGLDTLMFCRHPWALRHRYTDRGTGETIRSRCGSWSCLYCGPRKVDLWRQLVKAAEPTLFVTLTKVGTTLKEAARTLTTVLQYLRRGRKGRGKKRIGARPAYPIEVFAVLEEHSDFGQNGFHWHLLVKGVEYLPQEVVREALRSATGGRSYIVWVKRVKNSTAVGYVMKYLTKEIARERRGLVEEERVQKRVAVDPVEGYVTERGNPYLFETRYDEQGRPEMEEERQTVQRLCKAHRIRYSRRFFPARTAELRRQIFGEQVEQEEVSSEAGGVQEQDGGRQVEQRSGWMLYEVEPRVSRHEGARDNVHVAVVEQQMKRCGLEPDLEEYETRSERYQRMHREALLEALERLRDGEQLYSRRIIGLWNYQRGQLRTAEWRW